MNILEIMTLFGMMTVLAALPSASVALVITRAATLGVANGIAVAVGIVLGDLVFILLAFLGLSVVAETMGMLFMVIKYLGAAYLIWLGYGLLTSTSQSVVKIDKTVESKSSLITSLFAGFFLTLGDIKAIVFYVSLFPVFINLDALMVSDVLTVVSVMILSVGGVKIIYAVYSAKIATLAKHYEVDNALRKTAGGVMVGAGSYLIIKA